MERKNEFVEKLGDLLRVDDRSEVEDLYYGTGYTDGDFNEIVVIVFKGGFRKAVNVTGDSCKAIAEEVIREAY